MFGFNNPGQFFGPANLLDCYKNMDVSVGGENVSVAVNKYKNANHGSAPSGCDAALKVKDALKNVAHDAWDRAGGPYAYVGVFSGKGSPWEITAVLETFAIYSDKFISTFKRMGKSTPQGQCALILEDDTISWEETLQKICDSFIGLDCNGFVGNWLKVVQPEFKFNENVKSNDVKRKAQAIRKDPTEFEYWDILCYVQNEHIAAIHTAATTPGRHWICQSAGGGPRMNEFGFVRTGAQTFKLAAPTKDDIGNDFCVVSLW